MFISSQVGPRSFEVVNGATDKPTQSYDYPIIVKGKHTDKLKKVNVSNGYVTFFPINKFQSVGKLIYTKTHTFRLYWLHKSVTRLES